MWQIVEISGPEHTERWGWTRVELGQVVAESVRRFKTPGQALLDAERHGLIPTVHRCDIKKLA
jgi:hypothetical protein